MQAGDVIFLNGTSSAGKTTLAKALQEVMERPYLHTGIDHFLAPLPRRLFVRTEGITNPAEAEGWLIPFQNGALVNAPQIGPVGLRLLQGMYQAIAAFAAAGNNAIVDDVLYDPRVLQAAVLALHRLPVLFVGVRCPVEVAEQREQARGDRAPGGARVFHSLVHAHTVYDLEVDTARSSPLACAQEIKAALDRNHPCSALVELHRRMAGREW